MDNYYLSDSWKRRRLERLNHDNHTCQGCGITASQLQELRWFPLEVHHKNAGPPDYRYPSFGNEQLQDLLTLCSTCHTAITNSVREQRFKLDPGKKVATVSVPSPSPLVPSSRHHRDLPQYCQDHNFGREPVNLPQRADSRPPKSVRKSDESGIRQAQEN